MDHKNGKKKSCADSQLWFDWQCCDADYKLCFLFAPNIYLAFLLERFAPVFVFTWFPVSKSLPGIENIRHTDGMKAGKYHYVFAFSTPKNKSDPSIALC